MLPIQKEVWFEDKTMNVVTDKFQGVESQGP